MLFPNAFGETTFSFPFWFIPFGLYENCWSQVPACVQLPEAIQVSVEQEDSRSECRFCDDIGSSVLEGLDSSSEGLTRDSCPTYGMVLRSILDHSVDGMHLFLHSADQYGFQRLSRRLLVGTKAQVSLSSGAICMTSITVNDGEIYCISSRTSFIDSLAPPWMQISHLCSQGAFIQEFHPSF
jgi:hypothetical protein